MKTYAARHHHRPLHNMQKAERFLAAFRHWPEHKRIPRILRTLRDISPYLFEEIIISALQHHDFTVTRYSTYSGPGGLDGTFTCERGRFILHAKCNRGNVSGVHIRRLGQAIKRRRANGGLLIHTGRTPPTAYKLIKPGSPIIILSGERLADLMRGETPAYLFWPDA